MTLLPDDRVLVVGQRPAAELRIIASTLIRGQLTVIADGDAVHELRRELREVDNVMIVPSEQDGSIPFSEKVFSVVSAPDAAEVTEDLLRVLIPGGTAWIAGSTRPVVRESD